MQPASPYPLTQRLAHVLAARLAPGADLDQQALAAVSRALLDTIGVMVAGCAEAPVARLAPVLTAADGPSMAREAAMLLGTAAHALDFDDVAFGGHVSAVLVPALLAASLARPVSGADFARAYVAGYEVWSELATRDRDMYHRRGFHPTPVLGAVAAAGAVAVLLGLDRARIAAALGLGASMAAGLVVNFGSMAKPFHAGRAAEAGLLAAQLAQGGMGASDDALEGAKGFLACFTPQGAVDRDRALNCEETPGWMLARRQPSVKRYPVCYAAHRAVDAAVALSTRLPAQAGLRVEVTTSDRHSTTLRFHDPATVSEARFSLEFCVATALLRGRLGLAELGDAGLAAPEVRALMPQISRRIADHRDPALDGYALFDRVELFDASGASLAAQDVRRPRGHADNPADFADLLAKFHDCVARGGLPEGWAARIAGLCEAPAGIETMAPLAADLLGVARGMPGRR